MVQTLQGFSKTAIMLFEENGFRSFSSKSREESFQKQINNDSIVDFYYQKSGASYYADIFRIDIQNKEYAELHMEENYLDWATMFFCNTEQLYESFVITYLHQISDYILEELKEKKFIRCRAFFFKKQIKNTYIFGNEKAHLSFSTSKNGNKKYKFKFHKKERPFTSEFNSTITA